MIERQRPLPEIPEWLIPIVAVTVGGTGLAGLFAAWLAFKGTKTRNNDQSRRERDMTIGERVDDGILLADRIREEVERQVKPIREKLQRLEDESQEMHNAIRARETQLWLWDQQGRAGGLPMLPAPILQRLGLQHFIEQEKKP